MTSEDYERFFVNCHEQIKKANNFPNQIFTIACNRNKDKAWFVFFDYESDGKIHNVYIDKYRKSLYITVKC